MASETDTVPETNMTEDLFKIPGYSILKTYDVAGRSIKVSEITPLQFLVISQKKTSEIEEYLNAHPQQLNIENHQGWTALRLACAAYPLACQAETIKLLVDRGASFDTRCRPKMTSIFASTSSNILQHHSDYLNHPLCLLYSCSNFTVECIETAEYLLKNIPSDKRNHDLIENLYRCAIDSGIRAYVEQLMKQDCNPNIILYSQDGYHGCTPLTRAIRRGLPAMVSELVEGGAEIDFPDASHQSPFAIAVKNMGQSGGAEIISIILG